MASHLDENLTFGSHLFKVRVIFIGFLGALVSMINQNKITDYRK